MSKARATLLLTGTATLSLTAAFPGCGTSVMELPIETSFAFTNLSRRFYAGLQIRPHSEQDLPFFKTVLLPPGAAQRERFLDALGESCPTSLDLRVFLYRRQNESLPIGLDPDETVEATPIAAGEIFDVPACGMGTVETYTIVSWDAAGGVGRVKIAQDTPIDAAIRALALFPNADSVWEFQGVQPDLAGEPPPVPAERLPIQGRVLNTNGSAMESVGVLLRTRFRVRLDDSDSTNDPDAGFAEPIAVTETGANGGFSFSRPAGAYRVEAFADDLLFRPSAVDVETPVDEVTIIAEPIP